MSDYVKPSTAIARILRNLGLKQGADFRVKGQYETTGGIRDRIGTYVAVLTGDADRVIAEHADEIEQTSVEQGYDFRVSVHCTTGGRMWTWVANYGQRVREAAPVATADKDGGPLAVESRRLSHTLNAPVVRTAPVTGSIAGYAGLAKKTVGGLVWACREAGAAWFHQSSDSAPEYVLRFHTGRTAVSGWYLYGPGIGTPGSDMYVGATFRGAAKTASDLIRNA